MGVIHKLKPEVIDFVLQKKSTQPNLSCRILAAVASEHFQAKISKSSVNTLFKDKGLSMPIGRRRKPKRGIQEANGLGVFILKAADYLCGGTKTLLEIIRKKGLNIDGSTLADLEYLLYAPLFSAWEKGKINPYSGLWVLLNQQFAILPRPSEFQKKILALDLTEADHQAILDSCRIVKNAKIDLNGKSFYIDSRMHTLWPQDNLAPSLAFPLAALTERIFSEQFITLFMAPGYKKPAKELFDFLAWVEQKVPNESISNLKNVQSVNVQSKTGVFAIWPWQFLDYRKIKSQAEFKKFRFEPLYKDFLAAEAEIELTQPIDNSKVVLKGCLLKDEQSLKQPLIILASQPMPAEELAKIYLSRWPNLDESFRDLSQKIESHSQQKDPAAGFVLFNPDDLKSKALKIDKFLELYLERLDAFVITYLFPKSYKNKDFALQKENFYALSGRKIKKSAEVNIVLNLPTDYPYSAQLYYALRRLNEARVMLAGQGQVWFETVF